MLQLLSTFFHAIVLFCASSHRSISIVCSFLFLDLYWWVRWHTENELATMEEHGTGKMGRREQGLKIFVSFHLPG
jgi:hypothetical protein